ncbi:uncharacterized protein LOC136767923 [Amia ocellicauda]|uniref:uncharacterized protein LOC136767923 n=1 Tax=Amia ocellicauda TaxID=2972642 RepID=UPI003464BC27
MASLTAGLGRLLQPVVASVLECRGPAVWYGLLTLRLLALFSAENSWRGVREDFVCNRNITEFCRAFCFNHVFSFPTAALWSCSFLAALVATTLLQVATKRRHESSPVDGEGTQITVAMMPSGKPTCQTPEGSPSARPLAPRPCPLLFFLTLLLAIEVSFLWVLVAVHARTLAPHTVACQTSTSYCPGAKLQCVVLGRSDKQMAIVTLGFISSVNILASVGYTAYLLLGPRIMRSR